MKAIKTVVPSLLTMGLLAVVTATHGQIVPVTMNFALTITVQDPDTTNSTGVVKSSTTTGKSTTAGILKHVADGLGTTYPTGASLVLSNGNVLVVDKTGALLDDLTVEGLFTFDDSGNSVDSGTSRTNNAAGSKPERFS